MPTRTILEGEINQRQSIFRVEPLLHRDWIDSDHRLQRRKYIGRKNVAAARGSVRATHHHVGMDYGFSLIEGDVADHGQNLPPDHRLEFS
jgi:hypothetical protein